MKRIVFLLLISGYLCFAQNPKSVYLQLHQIDYPEYPLPTSCEVYGVSTDFFGKSIIAFDHRGERIVLENLRPNGQSGGSYSDNQIPKLFSFSKHHTTEVPYENGFLLEFNITDVTLFHKYSGVENTFNIYSEYDVHFSVSHRNRVIHSDTFHYGDIVGTFESTLRKKDVHVVATNKAMQIAPGVRADVYAHITGAFKNTMQSWVDLSFNKQPIKFFRVSKVKKMMASEQIKALDKRIDLLAKLDGNSVDRLAFDTEVNELQTEFESLMGTEDYKNHDGFKSYVHANLASLFNLSEFFGAANEHFEIALSFDTKSRLERPIAEERDKMDFRARKKMRLFDELDQVKPEYSNQYQVKRKTLVREIN